MKERLISLIRLVNNRNLKYFNLLDILMCLNLETEFCEYSNINVFKYEESDKVSVDSIHTQGACGGDLMDSPAMNVSHLPTTDAEYVFVSSNTTTILRLL